LQQSWVNNIKKELPKNFILGKPFLLNVSLCPDKKITYHILPDIGIFIKVYIFNTWHLLAMYRDNFTFIYILYSLLTWGEKE
jgi:hypothetical protein